MRRPLAAAVGVSAVLHVCVLLWAGAPPFAPEASRVAHRDADAATLRIELRPQRPTTAAPQVPTPAPRSVARTVTPRAATRGAPGAPAARQLAPALAEVQASAQPGEPAGSAPPPSPRSMADILKSVPAVTREIALDRAPNAALAASVNAGTSRFAPLEKALTSEAPGEQRLAHGVTRVVTKDGSSFCMREPHGQAGATATVSTCP